MMDSKPSECAFIFFATTSMFVGNLEIVNIEQQKIKN